MQYAKAFTDALQFMWGEGFLSPGGPEEVAEMIGGLDISSWRVLDIGSGLGGVDILLAERHRAGEVIGIDVESQLVEAAAELATAKRVSDRVKFMLVEPGPLPFPDASFDLVFSKDAIVHIDDKQLLFSEVLRVLKPGGHFVAADWLWAVGAAQSQVVQAWLSRGPLSFVFTTVAEARHALQRGGFAEVEVTDCRLSLQASNRKEVAALEGPAFGKLAAIVGEDMAERRLYSAKGRQSALDSCDLIPSHMRGRKPGR
jgi:ubiquinone/menaquinone biosynthesis C-methylase UbiE